MDSTSGPWVLSNPAILGGKPCVRGTRLSVEFILELLASGANETDIVAAYPQLSAEAVRAAIAYAAKGMKNEVVWDVQIPRQVQEVTVREVVTVVCTGVGQRNEQALGELGRPARGDCDWRTPIDRDGERASEAVHVGSVDVPAGEILHRVR